MSDREMKNSTEEYILNICDVYFTKYMHFYIEYFPSWESHWWFPTIARTCNFCIQTFYS